MKSQWKDATVNHGAPSLSARHQQGESIPMSGPIIRKYGFPNFEQIFGKKEPQHGVDDTPAPAPEPKDAAKGAEKQAEGKSQTPEKA